MDISFLKSTRFWSVVIMAITVYLQTKGIIGDPEMILITTVLGGHVALRTVDRFAEKSGAVDTGTVIAPPTPSKVDVPKDQ